MTGAATKTETYTYIYEGASILMEVLSKVENGGAPVKEVTRYVHSQRIDEPLAMERGGQYYFFHANRLGSVAAITNTAKTVVQSYTYDSFGMPEPSTSFRNSYTYTGREWDGETGLSYYPRRYYDPMAGRFVSKDPIGFNGGDVNLYQYVKGNPLRFVDPTGERILVFTRSIDLEFSTGKYVHCVLIVEDCDGSRQTWDFQNDNQVHNPAKSTEYSIKNPKTTVVYAKDDLNDVVTSNANGMAHPDYDITGYNCCHWVESVLSKSGISWKNPNPWPFN